MFVHRSFLSEWCMFGQNQQTSFDHFTKLKEVWLFSHLPTHKKHEPTPFPIKLHHSFTTSKYQAYDCSVILCKTDPIKLNERLAQRYLYVNNLETSSIQDMKRFTESQKQILQRYEDLPSHLIDATIQTTSTRQAAIALQRLFTLDFGIFLTLPK